MSTRLYREVTLTLTYRVEAVDCPVPTEREAERLVMDLVQPPRNLRVVEAPAPYDWTMRVTPVRRQVQVTPVQMELRDPGAELAEWVQRTLELGHKRENGED